MNPLPPLELVPTEIVDSPMFQYRTAFDCGAGGTLLINGLMSGRVTERVAYVGLHPWAWVEPGGGTSEELIVLASLGPVAWSPDGESWFALDARRRGPELTEAIDDTCPAFVQRLDEALHLKREFEPPGRYYGGSSLLADDSGRIDRSMMRLAARIDEECPLVQQAKPFRVPIEAEDVCVRELLSDAGFQGWMLRTHELCCMNGWSRHVFDTPVGLPDRWTREPYTVPPQFDGNGPVTCNLDESDIIPDCPWGGWYVELLESVAPDDRTGTTPLSFSGRAHRPPRSARP